MSDGNSERTSKISINRRRLLKSLSTVGSVGFLEGTRSVRAAKQTNQTKRQVQLLQHYSTVTSIQAALYEHGQPIVETLVEHGYLTEPTFIDSLDSIDDNAVRIFTNQNGGTLTSHLILTRETPNHRVEIHVEPQAARAFAFVDRTSGSQKFKIEKQGNIKPLEFCNEDWYCTNQKCWTDEYDYIWRFEEKRRCCTYGDGSTDCEVVDRECVYYC